MNHATGKSLYTEVPEVASMDWYTATVFLTVLFAAGDASQRVLCPSTTTLATFNSALIPSFAAGADPEIEERTAILIQQVNGLHICVG